MSVFNALIWHMACNNQKNVVNLYTLTWKGFQHVKILKQDAEKYPIYIKIYSYFYICNVYICM